jgi:Domain of unknown function (DUF4349)
MVHVNTAHRGARIAAALAAVILGVTACANDAKSSSTRALSSDAPAGTVAASVNGDAATASPSAETPAKGSTGVDLPELAVPQSKFLAIDVSYGIEVNDISKGINDVVALSDRHAGQIYERTINITDDRSSTASFVIKLPPEQLEQAIADLDAIGTQRTASQGTEDVTGQAVDIDARLVTAQASLDRVRKLLESATDLGQILSLESQLTERETLVEQYTAMKRAISDRVSLATLRVQLTLSPDPLATTTVGNVKPAEKPSIGRAFRSGWNGFVKVLAAILIFIGYTAPFLAILVVAALVLLPINRRRRRRLMAQQSRSAAPPPPPTPVADQQTSEHDSVGAARSQ